MSYTIADKRQFYAFVESHLMQSEVQTERDGEYLYENWLAPDGRELASVIYHHGKIISRLIDRDATP